MQTAEKCATMCTVRRGGFVVCPECERKHSQNPAWPINRSLLRIDAQTKAKALPVLCRKCQKEIILDIAEARAFECQSQ